MEPDQRSAQRSNATGWEIAAVESTFIDAAQKVER